MDFEVIELYQHHLDSWEDYYWAAREKITRKQVGRSNDETLTVRAAFLAGWFGDEYIVDVDKRMQSMKPAQVLSLSMAVSEAREVARYIDPFLSWRLVTVSLARQHHLESFARLGALKAGEVLTITVGDNGGLEILNDTTTH